MIEVCLLALTLAIETYQVVDKLGWLQRVNRTRLLDVVSVPKVLADRNWGVMVPTSWVNKWSQGLWDFFTLRPNAGTVGEEEFVIGIWFEVEHTARDQIFIVRNTSYLVDHVVHQSTNLF